MSLLSIQEVSKFYGDYQALGKVSLEIPKQSIYGLLGPNGAGKTSLIRIINQITAPDKGEIWLNGEKLEPKHISQIGYLPEERGLYPKMKVGEQLIYLARLKGLTKTDAKSRIEGWVKRFEITDWWNKSIEELSKGMAQKVQFISTVLHNPKLLIFDEPFTGFDPINTNLIKSEILRLKEEGATVIFSTHRMESVEEICDHIALINKSQKILEGPLNEIQQTHKSNTYRARLSAQNGTEIKLGTGSLVEQKKQGSQHLLKIKFEGNSNQLLTSLMELGTVLSFEEEIPSVNDIFIQKVEGL